MSNVDLNPKRCPIPDELAATRVVAIARGLDLDTILRCAEELLAVGVRAIEVTLDTPGAIRSIGELRSRFVGTLLVGAGTILRTDDVRRAVDAGACFLVAPDFSEVVVRAAVAAGIAVIPGATTPTEIHAAWRAGASAVKLFPARQLGPAYVRAVHVPLPDIPLLPTGGVDASNAADFLAAGAYGLGVGQWIFANGDLKAVRARASMIVEAVSKHVSR